MAFNRNFQNRGNETLAAAVTDVSERVTRLIREEIELAKAETLAKISSLARGLVAVGAGAVFGIFALIMGMVTLAWGIDAFIAGTGKIWIGFIIVTAVLTVLTGAAFMFAWRKLRVGAPTPKMAIEEAKKISATVRNGTSNGGALPSGTAPSTAVQPTVTTEASVATPPPAGARPSDSIRSPGAS
jgi:hypothetical protein